MKNFPLVNLPPCQFQLGDYVFTNIVGDACEEPSIIEGKIIGYQYQSTKWMSGSDIFATQTGWIYSVLIAQEIESQTSLFLHHLHEQELHLVQF
jgi:hypothetical protein